MTASTSLPSLGALLRSNPAANPYLLLGRDLTDPNLSAEYVQVSRQVARDFVGLYSELVAELMDETELRSYVPGYKPHDHERTYLTLNEHEGVAAVFDRVTDLLPGAAMFTEAEESLARMKFLCVQVGPPQGRAFFFRKLTRTSELTRSKWMALWSRAGQYDRLEQPVLVLDEKIDFLEWDGYIYVLSWYVFEQLLGDQPEARQTVEAIVMELNARVAVYNLDAFLEACQGQLQMRLKILALEGREYLDDVTTDDVRRVAEEYGVPLRFDRDGDGNEQVVFETPPNRRFNLIKILENSCVRGALGDVPYVDASSKRPLGA
ncbi:MAG: DUF4868 domain-containing protein [Actinomycetota bacterium]|nr:DUF4868 domain-containing protein [Actinomycetota bacterium]